MKIIINNYENWHEADLEVPLGALLDPKLSLKAKGLLLVLAAHEEHPDATRDMLQQASSDGSNSYSSGLRELRDAGYLTARGHGAGCVYILTNANPVMS